MKLANACGYGTHHHCHGFCTACFRSVKFCNATHSATKVKLEVKQDQPFDYPQQFKAVTIGVVAMMLLKPRDAVP